MEVELLEIVSIHCLRFSVVEKSLAILIPDSFVWNLCFHLKAVSIFVSRILNFDADAYIGFVSFCIPPAGTLGSFQLEIHVF